MAKSSTSPTQRTLKVLRENGYVVDVVERFLSSPNGSFGIRKDYCGMFDLIAFNDCEIIGVQCGAVSGHSGHRRKIIESPDVEKWLTVFNRRIEIWSWGKRKERKNGKLWYFKVEEVNMQMVKDSWTVNKEKP